jgi:hypothetical protein
MSIEMSKETEEKLMKALSNDPVVKISNLNIQMKVSTYHRDYMDREDMLISIGELDEDIFTMANERALLKAIHAYINEQ